MNTSVNLASQRLSFVNKISTLTRALSDDETPTPSYLHKEINDISYESVGYCESLVEFLLDRLRYKSCNVKLKVLKVIRHVLEHGSQEFQLGIRQQVSLVKECTKFSGPPHPLHGNTPYVMVRNVATELCEKLYNMDPLALKSRKKSTDAIQSPPAKYSGMGPSRSGGAIQGFGNSPISQSKGFAGTILQEIEKLGTKLSETPADRQAAVLAKLNLSASSSNYQPPIISPDTADSFSAESKEDSHTHCTEKPMEKPVLHLPGKAGGGWNDDDDDDDDDDGDDEDDHDDLRVEIYDGAESGGQENNEGLCQENIEMIESSERQEFQQMNNEEKRLVESYVRQESSTSCHRIEFLSNSNTTEFLARCSKLKCDVIVDCIGHCLLHDDPLVPAKSLQLLEAMVYSRKGVMNIDVLTSQCKNKLVECFIKSSKIVSEKMNEDAQYCGGKWKAVQTKAAKLILILQQLSSQKDIYPNARIAEELSIPASLVSHKSDVAIS